MSVFCIALENELGINHKALTTKKGKYMAKLNTCLRNGSISIGEDFTSVKEVTHLYGKTATRLPFHNSFRIPGRTDEIACLLSEDGGDRWHNVPEYGTGMDAQGWNEILTYVEYNDDIDKSRNRVKEELEHPLTRHVFWRQSRDGVRWYKFQGVFKIDAGATRATLETERPRVIYRQICTTAPCLKVEEVRQTFTDDEFRNLKGRLVRVNFLDEITFSADCGDVVKGEVAVWPGTKLLVTDVAPGCIHVTCDTRDENLLVAAQQRIPAKPRAAVKRNLGFAIPRQDFAPGYVEALPGRGTLGDTFVARSTDEAEAN